MRGKSRSISAAGTDCDFSLVGAAPVDSVSTLPGDMSTKRGAPDYQYLLTVIRLHA